MLLRSYTNACNKSDTRSFLRPLFNSLTDALPLMDLLRVSRHFNIPDGLVSLDAGDCLNMIPAQLGFAHEYSAEQG